MKILVTGGCGFIGSNFILNQITNHNDRVLNLDKLTYAGNENNLISIINSTNYEFQNADICDYNAVSNIFKDFQPDSIVHFAAESHVDRSIDSPIDFVKTNINGTANLLKISSDYFKSKNEFRFIHVSTDEVFGSLGSSGYFNENSPYMPKSPYSASKASSDHLVRAWHSTYKLPVIITNCSNNYGPFQFPEKLIPLMIANCLDEKKLPIYGKGNNIRDWLYVNDHCRALNMVLKTGDIGSTYCIGGNNEIENIKIVNTICSILDKKRPRTNNSSYKDLISFVDDRPGHDFRYAIDSSNIKKSLGWKPLETFETGIIKTIDWYLNNEDWWRDIQRNTYQQERLGLKN